MGHAEFLTVRLSRKCPGSRRPAAGWVWLLLGGSLLNAATCPTNYYQNAALLIAVSNPSLPEGPRPVPSAGRDADNLQSIFEAGFGKGNVFNLKDAEATTAGVTACLDALVKYARSGSKVVVFISARGFATSDMSDGYILTTDAAIEKVPSTNQWQPGNGISIQTLRRKMSQMPQARERYLLLDLCRDPAERQNVDNLINQRILDKRFVEAANTRRIILASSGSQRSLASYYADSLGELLRSNPGLTLEKLFDELKLKVEKKSNSKQTPARPPAPYDGWNQPLLSKLSRRPGPLLAALSPAAMFFQDDPPPASPEEIRRINEAIAAEEAGQSIFVRYGQGNHFHGDPFHQCEVPRPDFEKFKLCQAEYSAAARNFRRAADLYRTLPTQDPEGDQARQSYLLEKAQFSLAQVHLLNKDPAGAEKELQNSDRFQLAESHNLLGISYLEQARYSEAEKQFQWAIRKAPHWGYPRHNLALALVEHGDYTAAEREYREAIEKTPVGEKASDGKNPCYGGRAVLVVARPYLYYNLAVLLQRLNRLAEAQKQYCLAEISFRLQGDLLKAQESADPELAGLRQQAAKINLADVNNSLGVLFETRNKHQAAKAQFDLALSNNPDLSAAWFNAARLSADKAEARRLYRKMLAEPFCHAAERDLACQSAETALKELAGPP